MNDDRLNDCSPDDPWGNINISPQQVEHKSDRGGCVTFINRLTSKSKPPENTQDIIMNF